MVWFGRFYFFSFIAVTYMVQGTSRRHGRIGGSSFSHTGDLIQQGSHSSSTKECSQSSCQEEREVREGQEEDIFSKSRVQRRSVGIRWKIRWREIWYQQSHQKYSAGLIASLLPSHLGQCFIYLQHLLSSLFHVALMVAIIDCISATLIIAHCAQN